MRLAWRVSSASDPATSSTPTSSAGNISQKSTSWLHWLTTANRGSRQLFLPTRFRPRWGIAGAERSAARGVPSALLDGLGFDLDGDLLADEDAAGLEGLVPAEAERLPVELGLGREAEADAAPGVGRAALEGELERDRLGHALDREVAIDDVVALARLPHRPALVAHGRPGFGVEEVAGAEVAVTLL